MEYKVMSNYVYDYIENEINYIKAEISRYGYQEGDAKDLYMLENMTKEKIDNIAEKIINESDFKEILGEIIHEYIYND